ncbi:beta-propeller domain-containing protein [Brevundimonas sp. VNH65]|uniref:beta-propeller domain-containing protein n=1 Tax=Brevundimonas sp. VNH65 TaxID=3400917 RepID=UPI003BFD4417
MFDRGWTIRVWLAGFLIAAGLGAGAAVLTATEPPETLQAFASETEFAAFFEARKSALERLRASFTDESVALEMVASPDAVTNTQEIGVDEGGLVKARGDFLVVLRRGRLFTISTAGGRLTAVDHIDAFPPGTMPDHPYSAWYDEMLVVGDRVVVIEYDYGWDMGGGRTQVVRFHLSSEGRLSFEDAYELKSFDYYSNENFASRLIGQTLILYAPLPLDQGARADDPNLAMPGMRAWRRGAPSPYEPIARPTDIHVAPQVRADPTQADTLHAVSRCDLGATPMRCDATGVIAAQSRSFYVSRDAIYLWTAAYSDYGRGAARTPPASVYRMPLDGRSPTAAQARGAPLDQFSFRERDGALDVVVQDQGGDGLWAGIGTRGRTRLVHLPLAKFGDGSRPFREGDYRDLPIPANGWMRQNRFVGDHVLISADVDEGGSEGGHRSVLLIAPTGKGQAKTLSFDQAISRIEPLGRDALVVTSGKTTNLNLISLDGVPQVEMRLDIGGKGEAESRSHGFFFRSEPNSGGDRGIMALPILRRAVDVVSRRVRQAVEMVFVRRDGARLERIGGLGTEAREGDDDGCIVSCVDWYGDARPIFVGDRMFALLGYELVEGRRDGNAVVEIGRLDFSPSHAGRH